MKTRASLASVIRRACGIAIVVLGASLSGACAVSFSETSYSVTDGGGTCDETQWFCADDQTYCSCSFVTPAEAAHPTKASTPTCNNDAFDGVTWACWATASTCNCGPATSTSPIRPADSTVVNDCCAATGACTVAPAGLAPPTTCP